MATVKVFVKFEIGKIEKSMEALETMGFKVDFQSEMQPEVFVGTVDENQISELKKIDGVVGVWKDVQFSPTK